MKIIITKKDVDEAGEFGDIHNCVLAKVMQRELGDATISVCTFSVDGDSGVHGKIKPSFHAEDYDKLISGEIEEFVTEYTPL